MNHFCALISTVHPVPFMESNQMPTEAPSNAVLDDPGLQAALLSIHPGFGDLCIRAAGEVWATPLLSQRIEALITIAIDVVNQGLDGPGSPFEAHIRMVSGKGPPKRKLKSYFCSPASMRASIRQPLLLVDGQKSGRSWKMKAEEPEGDNHQDTINLLARNGLA
jgi:hypothetical protein